MELYRAGNYGEAFNSYTTAIRLCPSKPVYHANRAAAALRLGQHAIALTDARSVLSMLLLVE